MPFVSWQDGHKTVCRHGHDLTVVGFYVWPKSGNRTCAVCLRARTKRQNIANRLRFLESRYLSTPPTQRDVLARTFGLRCWHSVRDAVAHNQILDNERALEPVIDTPSADGFYVDLWAVYRQDRDRGYNIDAMTAADLKNPHGGDVHDLDT